MFVENVLVFLSISRETFPFSPPAALLSPEELQHLLKSAGCSVSAHICPSLAMFLVFKVS